MGAVIDMAKARDAKLVGTTDPVRLALIIRILATNAFANSPAFNAKLAAAQRLLRDRP